MSPSPIDSLLKTKFPINLTAYIKPKLIIPFIKWSNANVLYVNKYIINIKIKHIYKTLSGIIYDDRSLMVIITNIEQNIIETIVLIVKPNFT